MQLEDRAYQVRAHELTIPALNRGEPVLIQSPTRSGKSVMMGKVIRDLMRNIPNFRCLVILDREVLVRQLAYTIAMICGFPPGIACGSVSNRKDYDKYCTVGSRQTVINDLGRIEPVHLIIVDEAHLLGCREEGKDPTQYETIITTFIDYNPNTRIIGYTATPWGLAYGYLYGDQNKETCEPWFPELTHKITYKELLENDRLTPMEGVIVDDGTDLSQVSITAGEFNLADLSAEKCKHVDTVPEAIKEYAEAHSFIIIFCVDIKHINEVVEALNNDGIPAVGYHSKQSKKDQVAAMDGYKSGLYRCIASVGKLAIGFDHAETSCVVMLRDTQSSALFLQMICRGMTPHQSKAKTLLIDITKNSRKHLRYKNGVMDLDDPIVKIPRGKKKEDGDEKKEAPYKVCDGRTNTGHSCPECGGAFSAAEYRQAINDNESQCPFCFSRLPKGLNELHLNDSIYCNAKLHPVTMICPDCGYEYEQLIAQNLPSMKEVKFDEITPDPQEWIDIIDIDIDIYEGRKGLKMIRITFELDEEKLLVAKSNKAWEYICIPPEYEDGAAWYGEKKWAKYCSLPFDENDLNMSLWTIRENFNNPEKILARINKNGYYEIEDVKFTSTSCGEDVPF